VKATNNYLKDITIKEIEEGVGENNKTQKCIIWNG
jgi:hypothetical protein